MRAIKLCSSEVLAAYDAVSALYPHVPSLSHWRAWEYAAYQKYRLQGRILDLGCGDGRYFRLLWPDATDVVGVDMDAGVAEAARQSGIYRAVHVAAAHEVPEDSETFDHVFANCSLEHMDHLDSVLAEIARCLKPEGTLLCSVVTDRFLHWALLPGLLAGAGFQEAAAGLQREFVAYHHLANPLPASEWQQRLAEAGLVPEEHVPILPEYNSGIFLLMDTLWHVKRTEGGEMGDAIHPFLADNPRFPSGFRHIVAGLLEMEGDWADCSGAVFLARKPG